MNEESRGEGSDHAVQKETWHRKIVRIFERSDKSVSLLANAAALLSNMVLPFASAAFAFFSKFSTEQTSLMLVLIIILAALTSIVPTTSKWVDKRAAFIAIIIAGSSIAWMTWNQSERTTNTQSADAPKPNIQPPRLEIRAWLDRPSVEQDQRGRTVTLEGDGERNWNEPYVSLIEVRSPSRINSTLIRRIPARFNDFEPGETITAKICGLDFDKETYARSDRRYTDQMVWQIPIPSSEAQNCTILSGQ